MRSTAIITILFLCTGGALRAQQTASGSSSISSRLNTLDPPPEVASPPARVLRGHPVLGWDEYRRRKDSLPSRGTEPAGPPQVQTVNLTGQREPEPVRQPLALTPSSSWEGIQQTQLTPPDPDMAAGPEDIIQVVNSAIARFTKSGQQTNVMTFTQWFSALIPAVCPSGPVNCFMFDPSVRYDPLHGRFIIVVSANDNIQQNRSYWMVSVSNGSTYASGFKSFALDATLNGTTRTSNILDYPQFGFDNNAVYLTGNLYDAFNNLAYVKIRILKKTELYNQATTTLTYQDIWDLKNEDNTTVSSLRAAELRGQPGTGAPPGVLINASDNPTADYLTLWRVNNPLSASPTTTRTTLKGMWVYSYPAFFPQKGSVLRIDPGDSRVLRAVIRNGAMYTARNAGYVGEPTTITHDRIDLASNKVTLQARQTNGNFFYPAFDVPASQGPSNTIPNKLISGTTTDATGALTFLSVLDVKPGEDVYEGNARWGDYFGAGIDPVQGGLWVYGEYARTRVGTAGRWATWAAYFPWVTSPQFSDVTSASPYYDYINVMRQWSITTGCTATNYCPGNTVTRGQMAVFIIRAMMGDTFTFPATPYFTDVPAAHPYFNYIQKMRELGITAGCTATTYCPDDNVTRSQMAVFLVRGKLSALSGDNFTYPQTAYFTDVPAGDPRFSFVQKLRELGVTAGCTAATFCPNDAVTRDQMAVFIVRAFLN